MVFEYDDYFRVCFFVPAVVFFFVTFAALSIIASSVKGSNNRRDKLGTIGIIAVVICFWLFYPTQHLGVLTYGGVYLLSEQKTDAVEIQGTIDSISDLSERQFPRNDLYETSVVHGVKFDISGTCCSAFSKGDFVVGDRVCVSYLPQSGYILSMTRIS